MYKLLALLAITFVVLTAYAKGDKYNEDYVHNLTPLVQVAYTNVPCDLYPEGLGVAGVELVQAYATDFDTMTVAYGCAALYPHNQTGVPVAEIRLEFKDKEGATSYIELLLRQSQFRLRSPI